MPHYFPMTTKATWWPLWAETFDCRSVNIDGQKRISIVIIKIKLHYERRFSKF